MVWRMDLGLTTRPMICGIRAFRVRVDHCFFYWKSKQCRLKDVGCKCCWNPEGEWSPASYVSGFHAAGGTEADS